HADRIDAVAQQLTDRIRPRMAGERRNLRPRLAPVARAPAAGATGDRGQLDLGQPEVTAVQSLAVDALEERAVRLVEDHAQADHAGPQAVVREIGCGAHAD